MSLRKLEVGESRVYSVGGKAGRSDSGETYTVHSIIHLEETWIKSGFKVRHYRIHRIKQGSNDAEHWKDIIMSTGGMITEEYDPKVIYGGK